MSIGLGKKIYKCIKEGVSYNADIHCPMIIDIFNTNEGESEFCVKIGISRQRYVDWQIKNPEFKEAVAIAKEVGLLAWMKLYDDWKQGLLEGEFDYKQWHELHKKNFGAVGKLILYVDGSKSPIEQYAQVMRQAATGCFTSGEIKQIMESINVGLRAYEVCTLQDEITGLKEGLKKMEERALEYQISTSRPPEKNHITLDS